MYCLAVTVNFALYTGGKVSFRETKLTGDRIRTFVTLDVHTVIKTVSASVLLNNEQHRPCPINYAAVIVTVRGVR